MSDPSDAVAVIGMAARVPGADDVEEFWDNLVRGRESVVPLTEDELHAAGVPEHRLADRNYVRAAASLSGVELFDADFFGMTPRDAAATDPQIRLFLEIAHTTLENAGYDPTALADSVGVYAAVGPSRYAELHLGHSVELAGGVELGLHALNHSDYLATTVGYRLDLRGPCLTVLTACSSSLVALHLACQAVRAGDCDMAVVGGADVEFPVGHGYLWTPGGILSRDGHCRPFDAAASGTVFGSGVAGVLLKPLADAERDGDRITAVVLGSAVNNDGADKVSFGAPSLAGQAAVVMEAMSLAGVAASDVSYVEAHGTGTPMGDPIEVAALTKAYSALTDRAQAPVSCGVGSVKGNVGHLGPVAGIIGLIKTALALDREQLPPSINLETPNPRLDLPATPFHLVNELRCWPREPGRPRRAGVSSLGIGGTNVHVVLGEGPPPAEHRPDDRVRLLVWSARDAGGCDELAGRLADWFLRTGEVGFDEAIATLQHGRTAHPVRRALLCTSAVDARRGLTDPGRVLRDAGAVGTGSQASAGAVSQLAGAAAAWLSGAKVDWAAAGCPAPRRRAAGPGYPYQRRRHWVEPARPVPPEPGPPAAWTPAWRDATGSDRTPRADPVAAGTVLVVVPEPAGAALPVLAAVHQSGGYAVRFAAGPAFAERGGHLVGRPDEPDDVAAAVDLLRARGQPPDLLVHALGLAGWDAMAADRAHRSLPVLAAGTAGGTHRPRWITLTSGAADVSGVEPVDARKAALALSALSADPGSSWIDVDPSVSAEALREHLDVAGRVVALRGRRSWVPEVRPWTAGPGTAPPLRRGGTYLVVDRCGRVAVRFADAVAAGGLRVTLRVLTAAGPDLARQFADIADSGPDIEVVPWSGGRRDLGEALRAALDPVPGSGVAGAVLVASSGSVEAGGDAGAGADGTGAGLAAAAADALAGRPLELAVSLRVRSDGNGSRPGAELAWGVAAGGRHLAAERTLTVTMPDGADPGRALLTVLSSASPDQLVLDR